MTISPFDAIPEADPEAIETRPKSRFAKQAATVELMGNSGAKPKKTNLNPMQRRWFERHGWTFARVEHANAWGSVSQDLWGCADYLAASPEHGIMLVQTCRKADASTRAKKALARPELAVWVLAGGTFEVHGWWKDGNRWQVERRVVEPLP